MNIFDFMACQKIRTLVFSYDLKNRVFHLDPDVDIPENSCFVKKAMASRGGGHEKVIFHLNRKVNLKAVAAVHDSRLGFPLGGTRMRDDYKTETEAVMDALDLAEGMSCKGFWASTGSSGAKVVILGDPRKDKTEALLEAYGEFLEQIACLITGEDMNINPEDCAIIARKTKYVTGSPEKSGNPGTKTAFGVYLGLKAALKIILGKDSFKGLNVAIQGVTGNVGSNLAEFLAGNGAKVTGSYWWECEKEKAEGMARKLGIKIVPEGKNNPYGIFKGEYDILSLNATGKWLNQATYPFLKDKKGLIIGGAANNQLGDKDIQDSRDYWGDMLFKKGIWYLPDFVINAGGLINISDELKKGGYDENRALNSIRVIPENISFILRFSSALKTSPHRIADRIPKAFLQDKRRN